ncbi:prolyl 4-hydroxylase [Hypericibacter adhaerens]|uniref:Prolyl 4-hydroxylase n=1 Tax=Hypericibacter adhaerens TaxID=2602016 RepID=A0A5J6N877_9PROT|nr:2OG-Fe(II) oxygenase [Hypericibacter adhaerens]QEX25173.1 prolyl 4-hydroxylase [Hypericibacter adhaerens]
MARPPRKARSKSAGASAGTESTANAAAIRSRLDGVDWSKVQADLDAQGWAVLPKLLRHAEADLIAGLYHQEQGFRSHVIMARHGFGRGEYKYFNYPLPPLIQALRTAAYPHLVPIANQWHERMGKEVRFPPDHVAFLERCRRAGQTRPTPLLLEYAPEDYNCLHRDLYGEHVFPLQIAILLDRPGEDFEGGEFVMTEQRPRMQTRAMVLPLGKGDAAIFAVNSRPMKGTRGDYQVKLNHGVSALRSGKRHTVGVIFHDAA